MLPISETLDMAILAAPVAVVALVGLGLLMLLLRKHRWGIALLAVALLLNGWAEQIPLRMMRTLPQEKPEGVLRVFEYNVCGKGPYYPIHARQDFIDYVLGQDADVLFLPENSGGVCVKLEAALKKAYPYSMHSFGRSVASCAEYSLYSRYPLSGFKNYVVDNKALLREHPYLDSLAVQGMGDHFMAYEATADVNGKAVMLLHVHMRSNYYDIARADASRRRDKALNVYSRLVIGYAFRAAEARVIADSLGDCPNPLIICGDFNDLCGSRSIRMIQDCRHSNVHADHRDRLRDAWWEGGQGFGFTYADQHLRLRLDHILYSQELELRAVATPRHVKYSDHRPLVADFVLH